MKREELLRQLDETVDRLKEELEEATKQLQQFTAEESQRVPKWAKPTKVEDDKYFLANHWYHMEHPWKSETGNGWVWHSLTKTNENLVCQEHNDWGFGVKEWDLCYDDKPPEAVVPSVNVLDAICSLGGLRTVTFYDDQSGHVSNGDHERVFSFGSFSEFVEKAARMKNE
jgi:hypothetical protein